MIAVALFAAFSLSAQEPGRFRLVRPDSTRTGSFRLPDSLRVEMSIPDSLAHMSPWKTDFRTAAPMKVKPAVSMTSVVVIQKENLPSRVTVIDNNSLRLGRTSTFRTVRRGTGVRSPMRSSTHGRSPSRCPDKWGMQMRFGCLSSAVLQ